MTPEKKIILSLSLLVPFVSVNLYLLDKPEAAVVATLIFIAFLGAWSGYQKERKAARDCDRALIELNNFFRPSMDDDRNDYQGNLNHESHRYFNSRDYSRL